MLTKVMNRRALLSGAAMLGVGLAVAGCSTDQIAQIESTWANVAGLIQQAVAKAASYVPTIESVAATAASLFGPVYVTAVTVGSALFNQIVATLVNVVNQLSPPASAAFHARLRASSPVAPVAIGVTSTGVNVTGYRA